MSYKVYIYSESIKGIKKCRNIAKFTKDLPQNNLLNQGIHDKIEASRKWMVKKEMDKEQFRSLPEKLRRLILGQEAAEIGRDGVSRIAEKYNVSRTTVTKGKKEYLSGEKYCSESGSRKKAAEEKQLQKRILRYPV